MVADYRYYSGHKVGRHTLMCFGHFEWPACIRGVEGHVAPECGCCSNGETDEGRRWGSG
jgi:hypothetical protein